jgi:hypothetical protein
LCKLRDTMDAAASVITVIGAAITSAKTINDILSSIKHAPHDVKSLIEGVAQLQHILERLQQVPLSKSPKVDVAELKNQAAKCRADLDIEALNLQKLDVSLVNSRAGRTWRRVKFAFSGKEVERIRNMVQGHTSLLNVRLTMNNLQAMEISASAAQSRDILALLEQVRDAVSRLQSHSNVPVLAGEDSETSSSDAASSDVRSNIQQENDEKRLSEALQGSIRRLEGLLEEDEGAILADSEGADRLVADLEALLDSVQQVEMKSTTAKKARASSYTFQRRKEGFHAELKLIRSLIVAAPEIILNKARKTARCSLISTAAICYKLKLQGRLIMGSFDLQSGSDTSSGYGVRSGP